MILTPILNKTSRVQNNIKKIHFVAQFCGLGKIILWQLECSNYQTILE